MTGIVISSVQDSGGGDLPTESVGLRFSGAKVTYRQQKQDGTAGPSTETTLKGVLGC